MFQFSFNILHLKMFNFFVQGGIAMTYQSLGFVTIKTYASATMPTFCGFLSINKM